MKKYLPLPVVLFLHICHTEMFWIIKQILTLEKDNSSKYKLKFLMMILLQEKG